MALALTFDDGPGPSTIDLLRVLKTHGCLATFFVLGGNVQPDSRSSVLELVREGHLVGNHTMTHNSRLPLGELRAEIQQCDEVLTGIYDEAGVPPPHPIPFRLPFGIRTFLSERVEGGVRKPAVALDNRLQVLASMGRSHVHWTAILPDWEAKSSADSERLADTAMEHIAQMETEGLDAVLTMHDGSQADTAGRVASREFTVQAVDLILTRARARGLQTFQVPIA